MAQPLTPPGTDTSTGLLRALGFWDIVSIVIGGVIGSGIFLVPASIAAGISSPVLIFAVWITGGVLSFFGALAFAELGSMMPEAGGVYVYLREAYGPLLAFLFGWTLFLVIDSGAVATLAVAFASLYLPQFLPLSPVMMKVVAVLFIAGLMLINYLGVRWGANVQNVLTIIKFGALLGLCVIAFLLIDGEPRNWVAPAPEPFSWDLVGRFGVALVAVLWAFKGWEAATYSGGETRDGARNLPLGILAGTLAVIFIYIVANLAYLWAFPASEIAHLPRVASDVMALAVGPVGATVIAVIILLSITGATNQNLLCSPRVYFAMAQDGLFFRRIAAVHPRFRTPHVAILAIGAWSMLLSVSGTFEQLFTYVVFGQWLFFGLTVAAVFVLRHKRPDAPRPIRTLGYPVTPALFILAAAYIAVNSLVNEFWNGMAGLGIILLGLPAYLYWRRKATPAG
jgi:APA family basic amino acid/polyamine antiporter